MRVEYDCVAMTRTHALDLVRKRVMVGIVEDAAPRGDLAFIGCFAFRIDRVVGKRSSRT